VGSIPTASTTPSPTKSSTYCVFTGQIFVAGLWLATMSEPRAHHHVAQLHLRGFATQKGSDRRPKYLLNVLDLNAGVWRKNQNVTAAGRRRRSVPRFAWYRSSRGERSDGVKGCRVAIRRSPPAGVGGTSKNKIIIKTNNLSIT